MFYRLRTVFVFSLCVFLSGCGLVYTNLSIPRSYRSATPGEVKAEKSDPEVTGCSCYHSLMFVFAWGDAGYAAATKNALREYPDSILYDVKSDSQVRSVLGLYSRFCTVVTGKATKIR